jgi:hypothetical protein
VSYYPSGVTGAEYEISGPDREWSDTRSVSCSNDDCNAFDLEAEISMALSSYQNEEWALWDCPVCATEHEYRGEVSDDDFWDNYGEDY